MGKKEAKGRQESSSKRRMRKAAAKLEHPEGNRERKRKSSNQNL